jgi:NAD-dependent deacetylase
MWVTRLEARLEMVLAERRGKLALVTQNVDDLHDRAGCEGVIPWCEDLGLRDQCSACGRTRTLRPHVV